MSLLCAQSFVRPTVDPSSRGQRAAFLNETLWPPLTTIRIYFFPLPSQDQIDLLKWQEPQLPPKAKRSEFLDPLYDTVQKKVDPITLVKTVVDERIAPLVGLQFTYTTNIDESDIRIIFGPQYGCSSIVGTTRSIAPTQRREPTMYYGWLDVATVIHEFCHAMGMIHEHQNPQDNPLKWNKEAIFCYYRATQGWNIEQITQNVIQTYTIDQTNGSKYDPASIMIYPFNKTLKCKLCEPMNPDNASECEPTRELQTTLDGVSVPPVYKLSPTDIKWLQIMYPKDGKRDMTLIRNLDKEVIPGAPIWQNVTMLPTLGEKIASFIRTHSKEVLIGVVVLLGLIALAKMLG